MIRAAKDRGITLIELLVAMTIAGLVAVFVSGWIIHSSRMSNSSQARDDRDQELSLLRSGLFQDGTRGRTVAASRSSWTVEIPGPGASRDTVVWEVVDGSVRRSGQPLLRSDTVVDASIVPHFSGEDPAEDPWSRYDRDLDGAVDVEYIPRLTSFEWILTTRHRMFPNRESGTDTLHLVIPLQGPG